MINKTTLLCTIEKHCSAETFAIQTVALLSKNNVPVCSSKTATLYPIESRLAWVAAVLRKRNINLRSSLRVSSPFKGFRESRARATRVRRHKIEGLLVASPLARVFSRASLCSPLKKESSLETIRDAVTEYLLNYPLVVCLRLFLELSG